VLSESEIDVLSDADKEELIDGELLIDELAELPLCIS
jgi:hypothetical protein